MRDVLGAVWWQKRKFKDFGNSCLKEDTSYFHVTIIITYVNKLWKFNGFLTIEDRKEIRAAKYKTVLENFLGDPFQSSVKNR